MSQRFTVSVVRLNGTADEFKQRLTSAGMSAARVDQVLSSMPCTVKTNVAEPVARQYAEVFRSAGAEVLIEPVAEPAPGPPEQRVPTVNLRKPTPPPTAAPASEMPGIDMPAVDAPPAGPPPIGLDELPPDEPLELVSREHGFGPDQAGATPQRPRFPLEAPKTAPAIAVEPRPAGDAPPVVEMEADEPEPADDGGLEIAAVERVSTTHARAAGHVDKQVSFKVIAPPPPLPWWRRRLPHMITAAVLLVIGSYVYGCTKVHGRAIDFRRELGNGMREKMRHPANQDRVWTPAGVKQVAREVARDHGFELSDVRIQVEELCTLVLPTGGCQMMYSPSSFSRLDPSEQVLIAKPNVCPKPDWIMSIQVDAGSRWGLYSYDVTEVATLTLTQWSPTEAIEGNGRCTVGGEALQLEALDRMREALEDMPVDAP